MEFYTARNRYEEENSGFNSQRDGILRNRSPTLIPLICGFNSQRDGILLMGVWLQRVDLSFNSQRDGILLVLIEIAMFSLMGFNSQRDGILRCHRLCRAQTSREFQFPTGWNSTSKYAPCIFRRASFNSQRDGILREIELTAPLLWSSFNSQRDGILHRWRRCLLDKLLFQFPTGWNSTRFWFLLPQIPRHVSIPNGMEFYPLSPLLAFAYFASFNSQRDGILRAER